MTQLNKSQTLREPLHRSRFVKHIFGSFKLFAPFTIRGSQSFISRTLYQKSFISSLAAVFGSMEDGVSEDQVIYIYIYIYIYKKSSNSFIRFHSSEALMVLPVCKTSWWKTEVCFIVSSVILRCLMMMKKTPNLKLRQHVSCLYCSFISSSLHPRPQTPVQGFTRSIKTSPCVQFAPSTLLLMRKNNWCSVFFDRNNRISLQPAQNVTNKQINRQNSEHNHWELQSRNTTKKQLMTCLWIN